MKPNSEKKKPKRKEKCDSKRARASEIIESNIKRKSKNNSFYENDRLEMENGMRL